jgi:hypothetical protein
MNSYFLKMILNYKILIDIIIDLKFFNLKLNMKFKFYGIGSFKFSIIFLILNKIFKIIYLPNI